MAGKISLCREQQYCCEFEFWRYDFVGFTDSQCNKFVAPNIDERNRIIWEHQTSFEVISTRQQWQSLIRQIESTKIQSNYSRATDWRTLSRILVIEDDPRTSATVKTALQAFNHVVDTVNNGSDGLEYLLSQPYELAIVDWELPGLKGDSILLEYRKRGGNCPILFLTAMNKVADKVHALDGGADDYLCKPFSLQELLARVNSLLRRSSPSEVSANQLTSGDLVVDTMTCTVTIGGEVVKLTAGEFKLLALLMQNPSHVLTLDVILSRTAGGESTELSLRQNIACLRKKLSKNRHDQSIVTVTGQGYKFESQ
jgi:Response regulators consisting of a CheY-like receiver domain and a winged-helix DNA-binding domain